MVFNTSAGLVSLNMFYGYDTEKKKVKGEQIFKKIIEGVEMKLYC